MLSQLYPSQRELLTKSIIFLRSLVSQMNISGTLNVFRLLRDPTLCLPQHTVSTFNQLPIPLSRAFPKKDGAAGGKEVDIQAVVLDKDNCFAIPHTNEVYKSYQVGQIFRISNVLLSCIYPQSFFAACTSPQASISSLTQFVPIYSYWSNRSSFLQLSHSI